MRDKHDEGQEGPGCVGTGETTRVKTRHLKSGKSNSSPTPHPGRATSLLAVAWRRISSAVACYGLGGGSPGRFAPAAGRSEKPSATAPPSILAALRLPNMTLRHFTAMRSARSAGLLVGSMPFDALAVDERT